MNRTTRDQPRDKDGKYDLGKMSTLCRCGHTLGCHTAVRHAKEKDQPCLEDGCECGFFTRAR